MSMNLVAASYMLCFLWYLCYVLFQWKYALTFSALVDGTFRIQIDEADPIYPRYRTQLALDGEPKADG